MNNVGHSDIIDSVNILILDDQEMWQETTRVNCELIFEEIRSKNPNSKMMASAQYFACGTIEEACRILSDNVVHILFLDKDLGTSADGKRLNGVDFVSHLKAIQPFCQILVLTADTSPQDIARAIRNGASDYLLKGADENFRSYRHEVIKRAL